MVGKELTQLKKSDLPLSFRIDFLINFPVKVPYSPPKLCSILSPISSLNTHIVLGALVQISRTRLAWFRLWSIPLVQVIPLLLLLWKRWGLLLLLRLLFTFCASSLSFCRVLFLFLFLFMSRALKLHRIFVRLGILGHWVFVKCPKLLPCWRCGDSFGAKAAFLFLCLLLLLHLLLLLLHGFVGMAGGLALHFATADCA